MFHGIVAGKEREAFEVAHSFHLGAFAEKDFSTPEGAVISIACAVKDESQGRAFEMVFCHDGKGVGMMVLDFREGDGSLLCHLFGEIFRDIARMKVAEDFLRSDSQHVFPVFFQVKQRFFRTFFREFAGHFAEVYIAPAGKAD